MTGRKPRNRWPVIGGGSLNRWCEKGFGDARPSKWDGGSSCLSFLRTSLSLLRLEGSEIAVLKPMRKQKKLQMGEFKVSESGFFFWLKC